MPRQVISTTPHFSGLGNKAYESFEKVNDNFLELYTGANIPALAPASALTGAELFPTMQGGALVKATLPLTDRTVATYAAARLLPGITAGDRLQVLGRTAQSDGGQGLFTWVAGGSTTINDGTQLSATGGIWQRDEKVIRVKMFGTVEDGVADDAAALNLAIQAAIILGLPCYLTIGKTYSIASPLICGYFSGGVWAYSNLWFGSPIPSGIPGAQLKPAVIVPTFKDRPALCVQGARYHYYYGFEIQGLNDVSALPTTAASMVNSNWVVASCRDSRYSPYAGICIDPFGTSAPPDGGYPGMSAYYVASAAGSSICVLNLVTVNRFVVGAMITPNPDTQNAEDISFYDCYLTFNKVGLGIGQSQSRCVNINGMGIFGALYCFDGLLYGRQQGFVPKIHGANLAGKFLFHMQPAFGEPISINDVHAETFASIGYFGPTASSQQPVVFRSCHFTVSNTGTVYADYHLYSRSAVTFDGCFFLNNSSAVLRFACLKGIRFNNCEFATQNDELQLAPVTAVGGYGLQFNDIHFDSCYAEDSVASIFSMYRVLNGRAQIDGMPVPYGGFVKFNGLEQIGPASDLYFNGGTQYDNSIFLGSVTVTVSGGNGTFTAGDVSIIRLGDLVYTTTSVNLEGIDGALSFADNWFCLGAVSNIAGSVVTINGLPQNVVTGIFALYAVNLQRFHGDSVGDTNSSTSITNVTHATSWRNGNRIRGPGIPVGAYVTNVSGTTLTISKAATATAIQQRLFDADMRIITAPPMGGTAFAGGNTGAAPAPNFNNGPVQLWTLSANATWGAPTNPPIAGQILTLVITSNGSWTCAFNAAFHNASGTTFTISAATNGQIATLNFMYNGNYWQFIGGSTVFA